MHPSRRPRRLGATLALAALLGACTAPGTPAGGVQRLYVLYCGEARIPDISPWSPGVDVGKAAVFSDNCYLVQHGKDWMLWDSGYPDAIADKPEGVVGPRSTALRTKTLASQLAEIGVAPSQVTYLAFSHSHGDHVGNANLFTSAALYIQKAEYAAAFGAEPAKYGFVPATYDKLRQSRIVQLDGDTDVFGDGSVRILSTPGHTPGHQSLLVHLRNSGFIMLSGDVAHLKQNFEANIVPSLNTNKADSIASMQRVRQLIAKYKARFFINHDKSQTDSLQLLPSFYD